MMSFTLLLMSRFPGAQPVSMTYSSLTRLEENKQVEFFRGFLRNYCSNVLLISLHCAFNLVPHHHYSFWVCEKTDGVRVLLLIVWNGLVGQQETFLVSRPLNQCIQGRLPLGV